MSVHSDKASGFEMGSNATERPKIVTDEHLEYLDELRESGVTNMWGARTYLMEEFTGLSPENASEVLGYWMKSFGNVNR